MSLSRKGVCGLGVEGIGGGGVVVGMIDRDSQDVFLVGKNNAIALLYNLKATEELG